MKRLNIVSKKPSPSFISIWEDRSSIYSDIIRFFEANTQLQFPGTTSGKVKIEEKQSIDMSISPDALKNESYSVIREYFSILANCYKEYVIEWPFIRSFGDLEIGPFNIQKYDSGGHFSRLHCERSSYETANRVFAWMTYLNDVESGGLTEFPHYGVEIQPKAGTTLIWPAEWTHAHRGNPVEKGEKYIITGWMNFPL